MKDEALASSLGSGSNSATSYGRWRARHDSGGNGIVDSTNNSTNTWLLTNALLDEPGDELLLWVGALHGVAGPAE